MVSSTDHLILIDDLRYLLVVWKQHPIFISWSDVRNYVDECFVLHPRTGASSDESKASANGFYISNWKPWFARDKTLEVMRQLHLASVYTRLTWARVHYSRATLPQQQCKLQHPIQVSKLNIVWEARSNQNQNRRSSRSYQHPRDSDTKLCETTGPTALTHYRA
jgi:hypothetical protein